MSADTWVEDEFMIENADLRWYDKDPRMVELFEVLEELPKESQDQLGALIIQFVNLVRKNKDEDTEEIISIGKERVLGLYKAFNKRRWYDKQNSLMGALNTLSTMHIEDCKKITEGLLETLNRT